MLRVLKQSLVIELLFESRYNGINQQHPTKVFHKNHYKPAWADSVCNKKIVFQIGNAFWRKTFAFSVML